MALIDALVPEARSVPPSIAELSRTLAARIDGGDYPAGTRLPTERELATAFRVSRGAVRKALDRLEEQGLIWRHVGRGTFVGSRPADAVAVHSATPFASPREIIEARLSVEPVIAGHAAHSAGPADIAHLFACVEAIEAARDWAAFEVADCALHRAVALATRNNAFVALLDTINRMRAGEPWLRTPLPALDSSVQRASTAMHRTIAEAIARQDMHGAIREMRRHLDLVRTMYIDVPAVP